MISEESQSGFFTTQHDPTPSTDLNSLTRTGSVTESESHQPLGYWFSRSLDRDAKTSALC